MIDMLRKGHTFYGKAQAIIRAGESGELEVKVSGIKSGNATIKVPVSAKI